MATVDKSDTNTHDNIINLIVLGEDIPDIPIVHFRMKKDALMKKLMKFFCERAGLEMATSRFRIDGIVINEVDCPLSLELKEWDIIEVFQQQSAGGLNIN